MPHLRELVKLHKDDDFALIGVNCRDGKEEYEKGLEKFGVSWISAWQDGKSTLQRLFRIQGFPTYVLLDKQGQIVAVGHGDLSHLIQDLLSQ